MPQSDNKQSPSAWSSQPSAASPRLAVVSGFYPGRRLDSHVNHSVYCRRHGLPYLDASYPGYDRRPHFRKLEVLLDLLPHFDWLFWLDDDAYFTDFSKPLRAFLPPRTGSDFIVCRSPSTKAAFTKFSSGQFFLRNSPLSREFLEAALKVDLPRIKDCFWRDDLGLFTWGEQDALVYLTETDPRFGRGFLTLLDHHVFNNRDFEFVTSLSEHFLVHFTGSDKAGTKAAFCRRLGSNQFLVPAEELSRLNLQGAVEGARRSIRSRLADLLPESARRFLRAG